MFRTTLYTVFTVSLFFIACKKDKVVTAFEVEIHTDSNGFTYETVSNDPTGLRLYTLENGLKVYLSQNKTEPKIQTVIPVRAGSVYDPTDNTGLAHYLEHMVFKGTDEMGTQNWEKEKVLLDSISNLYEQHKAATDLLEKKALYKKIDEVSYEASKFSIANEYDKILASLGAEGTNAWTWHEETVYINKIPSNELDKWLHVESERFSQLVLRIFHTELEAVYEEFNRGQDNDFRRALYAMNEALFPNHPYGQQTTIGTSEHLKNPSMVAIHEYFNKYYVPNNMAVILVGDLEFDETIQKVNEAFGKYQYKEVVHPERPVEEPLAKVVEREVFGPENERVNIAFRSDAIGSGDEIKVTLIDMVLNNSAAGLIDLNLNKKQLVQNAGSYTQFMNDYGTHVFYGNPKSGQSLKEVKTLILQQIEEVKKGNFEEWLLDAVINDLRLSQMRNYEDASNLAYDYADAFVHFQDWKDRASMFQKMKKVTKEELVDFANTFYKENHVVVYKRQGEIRDLVKVENPGISPIELNRDKKSDFVSNVEKMTSPELKPVFIDYDKSLQKTTLENGLGITYVPNKENDLMELNIIFDIGRDHNKKIALAADYLEYLGTDTMTSEQVSQEFYKLGMEYGISAQNEQTTFYLRGLRENLGEGLQLLENLWSNAKADQEAYDKYVLKIAKNREDTKADKAEILWNGLFNYGMHGEASPLRDIFTIAELKAISPEDLVTLLKDLKGYSHRFFYYGKDIAEAKMAIGDNYKNIGDKPYPEKKTYPHRETGNNVYVVNYDMVQAELLFLSKGDTFDAKKMAASQLFNAYFGSGLSSVVFQELRESKSLAYSAFASYFNARRKEDPNYTYAYIGTQANKLEQAVEAMVELMNNMPEAESNFQVAKEATLKRLAAERTTKTDIFWSFEQLKRRGLTQNNKRDIYAAIQKMTLKDLATFFKENIQNGSYDVMVVGNKNDLDLNALGQLGKVQELDVDYLFNYEKPLPIKN